MNLLVLFAFVILNIGNIYPIKLNMYLGEYGRGYQLSM